VSDDETGKAEALVRRPLEPHRAGSRTILDAADRSKEELDRVVEESLPPRASGATTGSRSAPS
jgi:hypothetical protein